MCQNRSFGVLEDVPLALHEVFLTLKPLKLQSGPTGVQDPVHVLSDRGIRIGNGRILVIVALTTPTTIDELRSRMIMSPLSARVYPISP